MRWHLNIMEYKGKLYARIGNKYLEISHTDKFEQLEIEANYSDMLIKELESLKKENELQQEHLMHNEAELIPLREKFQRLQDNILVYQQQVEDLKAKYNECVKNSIC